MAATRSAVISLFIISCFLSLAAITLYLNYGPEVCHSDSFLCTKSDICIPNKYKCNKFRDCLHGEDEDSFMCADLHNLEYYNKAIHIPQNKTTFHNSTDPVSCALSGYPVECKCISDVFLRCIDVGLTRVPRNISHNLRKISLGSNRIEEISVDSFSEYPSLTSIHMAYNNLSKISPHAFSNQEKLAYLILHHNNLKVLEKQVFDGLKSVRNLFMHNNCLEFLNLDSWTDMSELTWLNLKSNLLTFKNERFPYLSNLTILTLASNRIEKIDELLFTNLPNLGKLDLNNNLITEIHKRAFQNSIFLTELNVADNRITVITPEILQPLSILAKLLLGNNPIKTQINKNIFADKKNFTSLYLNGIDEENIDMSMFDNITSLKHLELKEFHYCALYAKRVDVCKPNSDDLSNSHSLLRKPIVRWTLWTVAVFTLVMNTVVLYDRIFNDISEENKIGINFIIRNLAVADLLMVIYLTVIGYHDIVYKQEYFKHSHEWESSKLCTAIGVMAVISSEVSMLILVFLSFERFLLIAVPFSGHQALKLKTAVYCMASIWMVGISISVAPLILWKHSSKFYGSNGLCYPLYIEDPFVTGWEYSAFMFLGLQTLSLLLLFVFYTSMFISVRQTKRKAPRDGPSADSDFDLAVRFFFIVLANILCWSPIIVLKIAALRKFHISSKMYVWLIIFIVPINALVNPLLYTFTTPKYKSVFTSKTIFKMYREVLSSSGTETSQSSSLPTAQNSRSFMKRKKKIEKKINEKVNTLESNLETTNGE